MNLNSVLDNFNGLLILIRATAGLVLEFLVMNMTDAFSRATNKRLVTTLLIWKALRFVVGDG